MNKVHRTLLNVMRIEVLLSLGLVMWVMSIEARAEAQCPSQVKRLMLYEITP